MLSIDYEDLKVKSYTNWDVYLHENQCYLGRVFILLKKDDNNIDDFLAIEGLVRDEFFIIGQQIKTALKNLFQPDKMNYAALSNSSEKVHIHFIPRYKEVREFNGVIFYDTRWGKNYAPYNRSFILEKSVLFDLRDVLKKHI
jgi:diadenosine tetraphosphate (Ap4A) HIT family hydrolase